jgi:MoaA/NifB/PqqE/SkfB family radical SAM enzyme
MDGMVRKVYRDFLLRQAREGRLGWVAGLAAQYALTKLSFLLRRPLCGPILGTVVTNYDCNLRCRMCRLPGEAGRLRKAGFPPLSPEAMLRVVDGFADLGTRGIGFTGGEPLLCPDILRLVRRTKERGMLAHLNTNGTLLTDERAGGILDAGTDSLNVSLDGATEASHDRIRGAAGSFGRTLEGLGAVNRLRKARGAPLRVKVVAVLSEDNVDEVEAYLALAARLGVDCVELIPRQPFPEGPGGASPASPELLRKVDRAVRLLSEPSRLPLPLEDSPRMLSLFLPSFAGEPSPLVCHAGYNSLAVDCHGRVFPCVPYVNWDRPVATLPGDGSGLPELWYSRGYDGARKETAACRSCTLNCQAELNLLFNLFDPALRRSRRGAIPPPEGV